jgi:hypothetical protein
MTDKKRGPYKKPYHLDMPFEEAVERFAQVSPSELEGMSESDMGPLELTEDAETGDRFALYARPDGYELRLWFDGEEPWATRRQLAELFDRDQSRITRHINNIIADEELDADSNVRKAHIAGSAKPVELYSLDMVLSVGYRVRASKQAIMFRRWANQILKQYLVKGYVLDVERLESPDGRPDYFDELLEKIRHIRASERRMWTRILELASFCSDYHDMTEKDKERFFATVQNAMHWAVTQETAAEVIYHRVDAAKPNVGLTHFKGEMPTAKEAHIAKNYYEEPEITALNIITSATLEFFGSQAEQRKPTTLHQFLEKMREFIKLDGRPLIPDRHLGSVSMSEAKERASAEVSTYKERLRLEKEDAGEATVSELLSKAREVANAKRTKRKRAASKSRSK